MFGVGGRGVKLEERGSELACAPLFEGLDDAVVLDVARQARELAVAAGGCLPQVERASVYLIVRGSMRLSLVSAAGREFVVTIAGRGDVLGELAPEEPPTALLATAQEPTLVLRIPWVALQRTEARAELTRRCNALLAKRVRWLLELIEDLALYPLDARLARVLARLHANSSSHAVMRLHRLNQTTLAQMTNATRPKINQHLKGLQRQGAIELDAGTVLVRDGTVLARIARKGR